VVLKSAGAGREAPQLLWRSSIMPCARLVKEYREVKTAKQDPEIQLDLIDETDIFQWKAHIQGPKDSPYEGGTFELSLRCPETYPLAPPKVVFVTPVFHPNVLFKTGDICLDILKPDAWTPAWTLQSVCRAVVALLSHPEADSPLCVRALERVPARIILHNHSRNPSLLCAHSNCDCGNLIRNGDMRGYRSMAKMYTALHAS
jgi:peroxin-4